MLSVFSVTTAAPETSLLTVAELREATGAPDSVGDAALLRMGRRASAALARACGIRTDGIHSATLLSETCEETFPRLSDCSVSLARRPVTEIISVTIGGETVDVSAYELNVARGVVTAESGWGSGKAVFAYKAGFLSVPDDLREAALRIASTFQGDAGRSDPNLRRENIPGVIEREWWVSEKENPLMSQEIRELIAPYVERWL